MPKISVFFTIREKSHVDINLIWRIFVRLFTKRCSGHPRSSILPKNSTRIGRAAKITISTHRFDGKDGKSLVRLTIGTYYVQSGNNLALSLILNCVHDGAWDMTVNL